MKGLWPPGPGYTSGEKIVLFRAPGAVRGNLVRPHLWHLLRRLGAQDIRPLPLVNGVVCALPSQVQARAAEMAAHPEVAAVEDNLPVRLFPVFHDDLGPRLVPYRAGALKRPATEGRQIIPWGVARIGAHLVWPQSRGAGVKVALIDTGVDPSHPDLAANLRGGINLINPRLPANDDHGHGTHVAGTVAAVDNAAGVVGVAPGAHLYAVKALDRWGRGTLAGVIGALDWCVEHGMDVINMSFGVDAPSPALHAAITRTVQAGCTVVAAAGNDGRRRSVDYPAAYAEVIAVAAVDEHDQLAGFSSRGPEVKVAAPGTKTLSTAPDNGYVRLSGTSMAAAHVSGAVALLLGLLKQADPRTVLQHLVRGAEVLPGLSSEEQGAGLVRIDRTLHAAQRNE